MAKNQRAVSVPTEADWVPVLFTPDAAPGHCTVCPPATAVNEKTKPAILGRLRPLYRRTPGRLPMFSYPRPHRPGRWLIGHRCRAAQFFNGRGLRSLEFGSAAQLVFVYSPFGQ